MCNIEKKGSQIKTEFGIFKSPVMLLISVSTFEFY